MRDIRSAKQPAIALPAIVAAQGICLDPFVGSGTTLEVARECGVQAIGLDISFQYLDEQASWRGLQIAKPDFSAMPLFAEVA